MNFDTKENTKVNINLTGKINLPGQFTVKIEPDDSDKKVEISNVELIYDGQKVLDDFITVKENKININRTAQVTDESKISLHFTLKSEKGYSGKIQFKPALIY